MGPYGSMCARIKTGRSHIAQDDFQTPLDPKKRLRKNKQIQNMEHWTFLAQIPPI